MEKLTLEIAKKIAKAAEKKAIENGLHIVISIYDCHGNLKYFQRMDETSYGSIRISQLKAKTSASFPISPKALAKKNASMFGNPSSSIPDMLLLGGGVPIVTKEGDHQLLTLILDSFSLNRFNPSFC